ncbi:serine hydrolase domain-containing protein [Hyphococcus lacteus]|uniref:Serine hydrolase domain-containing protein n=1 Tax=Hyphococcus lacteus TaxID=3143536 RepID=A0ABV3YZI9_9PROT
MKHRKLFSALSGLCICLVSSAYAQENTNLDDAWNMAVEKYVERAEEQGIVGSGLYFVHDGELVFSEHYGMADAEERRAVDSDTIFHWASITKTLTVVAVMQLVDRGVISLDDPITQYLPEVRKVHNPYGDMDDITLRHLITHTSGFRGSTFPWGGGEEWHPHEPTEWSQIKAMMPYTEIKFEPGSKFSYSNPGISMLGRVIEEVTGDDIEVYLTKNILMPLGMSNSYFDHTPYYLLKNRSNNYVRDENVILEQGLDFDTGETVGNGGLNAPFSDMIKLLNFWLSVKDNGNYQDILSHDTLEKMWKPGFPTSDDTVSERMGMGFFVIDHPEAKSGKVRRYIGHTGGQKGFVSFVYVDPKGESAALFTSNTNVMNRPRSEQLLRLTRKDLFETVFPAAANE